MTATEAEARMEELGKQFNAYSFKWGNGVFVAHQDGTMMSFRSAFLIDEDPWLFVFSEHNGYHFFCKEDLQTAYQFSISLDVRVGSI